MEGFGDLFNTVKPTESKPSPYTVIEGFLRGEGVGSPPQSINGTAMWYRKKYEDKYGVPPIGFNLHNFRKLCGDIMENYGFSCWELTQSLNKWFTTFETLGWSNIITDGKLTPSALKLSWVVDALVNDTPPRTNRNESYKKHSSSRRVSTEEERMEIDYTISY